MHKAIIHVLAAALLLAGCATSSVAPPPGQPPAHDRSEPTAPSTGPSAGAGDQAGDGNYQPAPGERPGDSGPPGTGGAGAPSQPAPRQIPDPVRGIHVSGWYAGTPHLLQPLLAWALEAGINTVVLDLKAEDGLLTWNSSVSLAQEIGANATKVADLAATVRQMQEMGFWVAGRIVVMNDQYLYRARPEWGIPGFPGGAYSFMDPHNQHVWRYNLDIAREAVQAGVDEIQFDYIRYPERLVAGYNKDTEPAYRTEAINGFLRQAMAELKPLGVVVSADVFGLTTSVAEGDDMQIGQDYRSIAEIVDYIAPMIYPSHYASGTYGLANPDAAPYETVKETMRRALERTADLPVSKHRPWIQDFTYPAPGAHAYGAEEVAAQIRALEELGIRSWMLWDPRNKYTRGLTYGPPVS